MSASTVEPPLRTKTLAYLGLVVVQLFSSIILKLSSLPSSSSSSSSYPFSPQSSLVLSESLKVVLSVLYLFHHSTSPVSHLRKETSPALLLHMCLLALIYALNNSLTFHLFSHADPGSIVLFKSSSTLLSALLLIPVRRFRLSAERWILLIVQMLGLVIAQFDACTGRGHLPLRLYLLIMVNLMNSTVANVWNEWVVKRFEGAGLATKNVWLYLFGACLNLIGFWGNQSHGKGFWEGYAGIGMLVVISNGFMGIAMNAVYKYADAVVKNVATTTTTVVLLAVSAVWFGGRGGVMVWVGGSVVIAAAGLYFRVGRLEERMKEVSAAWEDKTREV